MDARLPRSRAFLQREQAQKKCKDDTCIRIDQTFSKPASPSFLSHTPQSRLYFTDIYCLTILECIDPGKSNLITIRQPRLNNYQIANIASGLHMAKGNVPILYDKHYCSLVRIDDS